MTTAREALIALPTKAHWDSEFAKAVNLARNEAHDAGDRKAAIAYSLVMWCKWYYNLAANDGQRTPEELLSSAEAMMVEQLITELQALRGNERADWAKK